jgi:hypothetical protein
LLTEVLIVGVGILVVGHRLFSTSSLWRLARVAMASGAMAAVMYGARPLGFVVEILVGGVVFVGAVVALRVATPEEAAWVRGCWSKARHSVSRFVPHRDAPS